LHACFGLESSPERFIMVCRKGAKSGLMHRSNATHGPKILLNHLVGQRKQLG
jgi:hypothetical protein